MEDEIYKFVTVSINSTATFKDIVLGKPKSPNGLLMGGKYLAM